MNKRRQSESSRVPSAPQQQICFQVVGGAPHDLEYVGIRCGSCVPPLDASKNDPVTSLSSARHGGSGCGTVMGRSVTGGCTRAPSRGEMSSPNFVSTTRGPHWPRVRSMALTSQTSKVGSCADADQSALASSLAASRSTVLRALFDPAAVRPSQPRCATRLRTSSCPAETRRTSCPWRLVWRARWRSLTEQPLRSPHGCVDATSKSRSIP